jgi:radical SAM protein with 4Fe4S-binding SPASM domain
VIAPGWSWRACFVASYLAGDRAYAGPFTAAIDVTRRCNLSCFGCLTHAPGSEWRANPDNDDFRWEDFERVCRELRAMGTRKLVLIGQGEPTLHSRLLDMIAAAKRGGFHVTLITNGTLLDDRLAPAVAASGLDELRISLWASDEREYEHNYRGTSPRLFQRVLDGARAVSKARVAGRPKTPRIVLHRPIEREYFRGLERMVGLAVEAGCDALSLSPLRPLGPSAVERALSPQEALEVRAVLDRVGRLARAAGLDCNDADTRRRYAIGNDVWKAYPCYLGWLDVRIRPNGDVFACSPCVTPLGNIRQARLSEIWNGQPFRRFRRQTRTCLGLAGVARDCSCGYCCHVLANARLHRILRWLPRRT